MTDDHYKESLNIAIKELSELMSEREELDSRREALDLKIFKLREGLFGLAILCGTDTNELAKDYPELFPDLISPDVGLTDAVRKAMQSKRNYVSPVEVRDRLQTMGYDITKYKNILASIHTILKRLVGSEEVEAGNREGKVVYRWRGVDFDKVLDAMKDPTKRAGDFSGLVDLFSGQGSSLSPPLSEQALKEKPTLIRKILKKKE